MKKFIQWVRIAIAGLIFGAGPTAQGDPPLTMSWHTLDGGGGWAYGDLFSLSGTIGQPDAGYMSAGSFEMFGGFWKGFTAETVCQPDFDHDGFITGVDYDLFVQAFESGDFAADYDQDGFITGVDFDLFVQAFEAGCA